MYELIVAIDKNYGIGYDGRLPWYVKSELELFRYKTNGATLVVGRNTLKSLPYLENRNLICITSSTSHIPSKNRFERIDKLSKLPVGKRIIIAGGKKLYESAIAEGIVSKIHLSVINSEYKCDTFLNKSLFENFVIDRESKYPEFTYYELVKSECNGEIGYLNLLKEVLSKGEIRNTRNGITRGLFGRNLSFNLLHGFPLLTTKKMFMRGVIEECLFFISGNTDSTILSDRGVNIWKGNTSKEFLKERKLPYSEGVMGPMYGYQFRHFNAPYELDDSGLPVKCDSGVDQLKNVIELIENDPQSRRILMTSYNPCQAEEGVLYPCHSIVLQFYVSGHYLDMSCYNRSQDLFLGTPFNIASSALLLSIIAKITNKTPRYLHMSLGDVHLYDNHLEQAILQTERIPYSFPTLKVPKISSLDDVNELSSADFVIENYTSHPSIKADMVV